MDHHDQADHYQSRERPTSRILSSSVPSRERPDMNLLLIASPLFWAGYTYHFLE